MYMNFGCLWESCFVLSGGIFDCRSKWVCLNSGLKHGPQGTQTAGSTFIVIWDTVSCSHPVT